LYVFAILLLDTLCTLGDCRLSLPHFIYRSGVGARSVAPGSTRASLLLLPTLRYHILRCLPLPTLPELLDLNLGETTLAASAWYGTAGILPGAYRAYCWLPLLTAGTLFTAPAYLRLPGRAYLRLLHYLPANRHTTHFGADYA